MWKDVTSYSQGDKDKKPTCFSFRAGTLRLVIVWNHRYCPDVWSASLYGVYEQKELPYNEYSQLEQAKNQALLDARSVILNCLRDIEKELKIESL